MKKVLRAFLVVIVSFLALLFAGVFFSGGHNCLPLNIFCADSA